MARDIKNPDTAGKDMDMSDVRSIYPCPNCQTMDPEDHKDGCRYAMEE